MNQSLNIHLKKIKGILLEIPNTSPPRIRTLLTPLFQSRGKLLRPALLILASNFGSGPTEEIYQFAAAVELFHMATLIHDDIIDKAAFRRNSQTINNRWDAKKAVLAGDYLLTKALSITAKYQKTDRVSQLSAAVAAICSSEIDQTFDRYNYTSSFRTYIRRISGKTAMLFAAAAQIGAEEAGCSLMEQQILRRCAVNLGITFQIIDDIIDFKIGTGKLQFSDLSNGISSLPIIYALQEYKELKKKLPKKESIWNRRKTGTCARLILKKTNAMNQTKNKAEQYFTRGLNELNKLPESSAKTELKKFYINLLHREK